MKKLAKILVAVLAITALASLFAFAVAADGEAKPWAPAQDSGVTVATWASIDSYTAGDGPVLQFTETEITSSIATQWKGYVKFYSNVTLNGSSWTDLSVANNTVVVDLNGFTFDLKTNSNGFRIVSGDDALCNYTFTNGTVKANYPIHYKRGVKLTFDKVTFNGTRLGYVSGGSLTLRNSIVNLSDKCAFSLGPTGNNGANVTIENTTVNMSSKTTPTDVTTISSGAYMSCGVFELFYNENRPAQYAIRIDAKSKITTETKDPIFFIANAGNGNYNNMLAKVNVNIYIEKGAFLNNITPTKFAYKDWTNDNVGTDLAAQEIKAKLSVVAPGGTEAVDYKTVTFVNGDVWYADEATIANAKPVEAPEGADYGIWLTEDHYRYGLEGVFTCSNEQTVALTKNVTNTWTGETYVRFYKDVTYTGGGSNPFLLTGSTCVLDLAGHSFTGTGEFFVTSSGTVVSLTIKNGSMTLAAALRHYAAHVTFENLYFSGTRLGWASAGGFTFIDSTVVLSNASAPFLLGPTSKTVPTEISFINSNLVVTGNIPTDIQADQEVGYGTTGIFEVYYNAGDGLKYDITFDKTSSITSIVANNPMFFTALSSDNIYDKMLAAYDVNIYLEKGVCISNVDVEKIGYRNITGDKYGYNTDETPAVKAVVKVVDPGTTADASYEKFVLDNGDVWYTDDSLKAAAKPVTVGHDYATYAIFASEQHHTLGLAPKFFFGDITKTSVFRDRDGQYVKLFADVRYNDTGKIINNNGKALTIDLNDYTLYNVSGIKAGDGNATNITELLIKDGTVTGSQLFVGGYAHLTFDNVELTAPELGYFISGNLTIKNSVCYSGVGAISVSYHSGESAFVEVINTKIVIDPELGYIKTMADTTETANKNGHIANAFISAYYNLVGYNFNWTITLDETSSIEYPLNGKATRFFAVSNGKDVEYPAMPKVIIKEGFSVSGNILPDLSYYRDEKGSEFRYTEYARNDNLLTVVDANGDVVTNFCGKLNDNGTYAIVKADKPALAEGDFQANLTLYTNFNLNFYSNDDVVRALYLYGIELDKQQVGTKEAYVVEVPVDAAAENMMFGVAIANGEDTYLYRLDYSVLTYAKQIIGSNYSEASKQLITAAMEYVKAAYAYANKGAVDFTGVTTPAAENNATAVETLGDAISGAQLDLSTGFKLRFNLNPEYDGALTVGDTSVEVVKGKIGEINYVEVDLRAYELAGDVVIVDAKGTYTYSVANYAKSDVVNANAQLKALADALYTYATYAASYKASNPNLD